MTEKIYYKGFDENLKCIDFQYAIGETYKFDGKVKACKSGFHSCENPWDILSYYDITSRFCEVTIGGVTSTKGDDSKIASAEITIKAELNLPDFISTCIKWLIDFCNKDIEIVNNAQIASSGDYALLAISGDYAKFASSGDYAQLASSGHNAQLASSGDYALLASSGDYALLASSGDYALLASSGDYAQLAISGDYAQLASSGDYAQLASSGDYAKFAISGDYAKLASSGENGIIVSAGLNTIAKGTINTAIALTWKCDKTDRYRISVAYVGENGIEPDIFYKLNKEGEFIKV